MAVNVPAFGFFQLRVTDVDDAEERRAVTDGGVAALAAAGTATVITRTKQNAPYHRPTRLECFFMCAHFVDWEVVSKLVETLALRLRFGDPDHDLPRRV